jgi:hypothetical protein
MIGLLALMLLRALLAPLARLGTDLLAAALLIVGAELFAERFLDADLPRGVSLTLAMALCAAWRFLRSRWRRMACTGVTGQGSPGEGIVGPGRISRR